MFTATYSSSYVACLVYLVVTESLLSQHSLLLRETDYLYECCVRKCLLYALNGLSPASKLRGRRHANEPQVTLQPRTEKKTYEKITNYLPPTWQYIVPGILLYHLSIPTSYLRALIRRICFIRYNEQTTTVQSSIGIGAYIARSKNGWTKVPYEYDNKHHHHQVKTDGTKPFFPVDRRFRSPADCRCMAVEPTAFIIAAFIRVLVPLYLSRVFCVFFVKQGRNHPQSKPPRGNAPPKKKKHVLCCWSSM